MNELESRVDAILKCLKALHCTTETVRLFQGYGMALICCIDSWLLMLADIWRYYLFKLKFRCRSSWFILSNIINLKTLTHSNQNRRRVFCVILFNILLHSVQCIQSNTFYINTWGNLRWYRCNHLNLLKN